MNIRLQCVVLGAVALSSFTVASADDAAPSDQPSEVVVSGYIDGSYTNLSGAGRFTSGIANRVFDLKSDGFSLQQAAVTVAYQPKEGFGGVLNVTAGNDADVIASYGAIGGGQNKFDVTQAFGQYSHGALTVLAGKFVTLAGAEVINSPANPNFSRSILFGLAIPYTHTGIRTTYAATDTVSLTLGMNNGWDALRTANPGKTVELGGTYTPNKSLTLAATGYVGKQRIGVLTAQGPSGTRALLDLVATWTVSDALTVVVNYDWAKQAGVLDANSALIDARWQGLAVNTNYVISDRWKTSLRAEYFDDASGYRTGVAQKWREVTSTLAYLPTKFWEIRLELRADRSNVNSFIRNVNAATVAAGQDSIAVQSLFKF